MQERFQFFEEYTGPSLEKSARNVIAIDLTGGTFVKEGGVCLSAVCSEEEEDSSSVAAMYFNAEYLGTHCRQISEDRARTLHPRLFEYLDALC
jgi:hypothetical protein